MAELVEMLPQHRIDGHALARVLERRLEGVWAALEIKQFQGGQSNPTYLLDAGTQRYVLRKQPPGPLLPKAHQIDREHRVMAALAGTGVPVPRMCHYESDASIIGTPFYVMAHVEGRSVADLGMAELRREDRRAMAASLLTTLARLHSLDWRLLGLADFGRPDGYARRQAERWSKQYAASKTADIPDMDRLGAWLLAHVPDDERASIAHGDYRIGNVIVATDRPEVCAVLDWELSTIGHPLADLAYCLMGYHLPDGGIAGPGLIGRDLAADGLASEAELIDVYSRAAGIDPPAGLDFFVALALFRLAAIVQGVYARSLAGNASSASAATMGPRVAALAAAGLAVIARAG
ncbi:MAG: phosphotransferase family protein [Hyphomicrobiaceae bacterium]